MLQHGYIGKDKEPSPSQAACDVTTNYSYLLLQPKGKETVSD